MTSLSEILDTAFTAVSSGITDAVVTCRVYNKAKGAYNTGTGAYPFTLTAVGTQGRCIFDTSTPTEDLFPDSVAGPAEYLAFVEGVGVVPSEGQVLRVGSKDYTILGVSDVLKSGVGFYLAVRDGV